MDALMETAPLGPAVFTTAGPVFKGDVVARQLTVTAMTSEAQAMGMSHRRDDQRARHARLERDAAAMADARATIEEFNARLAAGREAWFWPTIAAALATKHHWLVVCCDACGTMIDLDLSVKRRHPDAPINIALRDVRCPRCNGHGAPRITALARWPSR